MRNTNPILYLAATLLLAACTDASESPDPGSEKQTPVELSAGIGAGESPETGSRMETSQRHVAATRASDIAWQAGDAIGLFMLDAGTSNISRGMANRRYINSTTGATANFAPDGEANTAWYPSGGDEVDLIAYYPYSAANFGTGALPALPISVADQSSLPAIDLMTSNLSTGHSSDAGKRAANLRFAHRLSKIVLDIKTGEGTGHLNLSEAKVTIGGTPATAVYNLYTADFDSRGAATDIALNMMGGRTTAIVIPPLNPSHPERSEGSAGNTLGDEILRSAQDDVVRFTVKVGTETFTATLPADKRLESGKEATITIRLNYTQPTIEAEIGEWQPSSASGVIQNTDVTKTIDLSALPDAGDITITPQGGMPVEYRYEGGKLTPVSTPIYWEDFVKYASGTILAKYKFSFRYVPDDVTGIAQDILYENNKEILWGESLGFNNLLHENTEIIVLLQKGSTYSGGAGASPDPDWANAKVTLSGFTSPDDYTLVNKNVGINLEMAPVVVTKNQGAVGKFVNLVLKGVTYEIGLNAISGIPLTLEGGKSYKLILTLEKTAIAVGEVNVKDFETVIGSGNIEYN